MKFERENRSKVKFSLENEKTRIVKIGGTKSLVKEGMRKICGPDFLSDSVIRSDKSGLDNDIDSHDNKNHSDNDDDDDGNEDDDEDDEQAASRLFISSLLVHGNFLLPSSSSTCSLHLHFHS